MNCRMCEREGTDCPKGAELLPEIPRCENRADQVEELPFAPVMAEAEPKSAMADSRVRIRYIENPEYREIRCTQNPLYQKSGITNTVRYIELSRMLLKDYLSREHVGNT